MQILRLTYKFLLYYLKSFRLHGIHSPFVFDLHLNVLLHHGQFGAFSPIESLRKQLLNKSKEISVTDYGAGSKTNKEKLRKIKDIARVSAKSPKYAQLLFRLVNYYQPQTILELGTSLGLSTAYLAAARQKAKVYTFEGCPKIAAQAKKNFQKLNLKNISLELGNLDLTLPAFLQKSATVDFVFFDGNHRYEPTMHYFNLCLAKHHENSIFVVDDIYWSAEMEKAWKEICRHPAVSVSVDLFQVGLLFFRKKQPKQHFTIWY